VIGAGNTAIDVATQAVRLGAERVTIVYRRTAADMSAFAYEYDLAKSDGVHFLWNLQPVAAIGADGWVTGVEFEKTGDTLNSPVEGRSDEKHVLLECDMVVKALGQGPLHKFIASYSALADNSSRVKISAEDGSTGLPGLFAGGDCTTGGAEIVDAVEEGKVAAAGIHQYLNSSSK
jgi:glutamate synthase (NADPH/NADH) small chain